MEGEGFEQHLHEVTELVVDAGGAEEKEGLGQRSLIDIERDRVLDEDLNRGGFFNRSQNMSVESGGAGGTGSEAEVDGDARSKQEVVDGGAGGRVGDVDIVDDSSRRTFGFDGQISKLVKSSFVVEICCLRC